MKLLSKSDDGRFVFKLTSSERENLEALLGMTLEFPVRQRPLSSDSIPAELREAEKDLDEALSQHRSELHQALGALLKDPQRCTPGKGGFALSLNRCEIESLLQALNSVRVGAWDRMGSPDFEAGERPKPGPETAVCIAIFRITDVFLAGLLGALEEEG